MPDHPGVLGEVARLLGPGVADKLGKRFAGRRLSIPPLSEQDRIERHARIRQLFNGENANSLARRFGLSRRQIDRIANNPPKKEAKNN